MKPAYKIYILLLLCAFGSMVYAQQIATGIVAVPVSPKSWESATKPLIFGEEIQFSGQTSGNNPKDSVVYLWNFGDGQTSSDKNPKISYTRSNCSKNYNVRFTVNSYTNKVASKTKRDSLYNSTPIEKTITVYYRPEPRINPDGYGDPSFMEEDFYFKNCRKTALDPNDIDYEIKLDNLTSNLSCLNSSSFTIDWGDGSPKLSNLSYDAVSASSHVYNKFGSFILKITSTSLDGIMGDKQYDVINDANPVMGLPSPGNTVGCAPYDFSSYVSDYQKNSRSTRYYFSINIEGSEQQTFNQVELQANNGTYNHTFLNSSCGQPNNMHTIIFRAENGCGVTPGQIGGIKVSTSPKAKIKKQADGCPNEFITFINLSIPGKSDEYNCIEGLGEKYEWDFGDGTPLRTIGLNDVVSHKYNLPGSYKVKLKAYARSGCTEPSYDSIYVNVNPDPISKFSFTSNGECLTSINLKDESEFASKVEWVIKPITNPLKYEFLNSASKYTRNPQVRFLQSGEYTIQLLAGNNCESNVPSTIENITVKDRPTIAAIGSQRVCLADGLNTTNLAGGMAMYNEHLSAITSYKWQIKNDAGSITQTLSEALPTIMFSATGRYSVTVTATNSCGESAPVQFDVDVIGTVDPKATLNGSETIEIQISEGGAVVFNDITQNRVSTKWEVQNGVVGDVSPLQSTADNARFVFYKTQNYTIIQTVSNGCDTQTKAYVVKVTGDFSASIVALPSVCEGEVLDMNGLVMYNLKNRLVDYSWKVESVNGSDVNQVEIQTINSEYPQFTFKKQGKYNVSVTLTDKNSTDHFESSAQQVVVYGNVTANASSVGMVAGKINAKINTNITLTDASVDADFITAYSWKVTDESNNVIKSGANNSFTFQLGNPGNYKVIQKVSNVCKDDTKEYSVVVSGGVNTNFGTLSHICFGEDVNTKDFVTYQLNNNEVTYLWEISPSDGVTIINADDAFPLLKFSKAGSYNVSVVLTETISKQSHPYSTIVDVFDKVQANIQPTELFGVAPFSISFADASTGFHTTYNWAVSGANAATASISNAQSANSEIQFTTPGFYDVHQQVSNLCYSDDSTYHITVVGALNVDFSPIQDKCIGATLLMKDYVSYALNNNKVTQKWKVTPGTGVTINSDTAQYPVITFADTAVYTIQLEVKNLHDGTIINKAQSFYVNGAPVANAKPNKIGGIAPFDVVFTQKSLGGYITEEYVIKGINGKILDDEAGLAKDTLIRLLEPDTYTITYTAWNNCGSDSQTFTIKASGEPTISLPKIKDQNPCTEYFFNAKSMASFEYDTDTLKTVLWTVSQSDGLQDGFAFENGTSNTDTFPDIHFTKTGIEYVISAVMRTAFIPKGVESSTTFYLMDPPALQISPFDSLICLNINNRLDIINTFICDSMLTTWTMVESTGWQFAAGFDTNTQNASFEFSEPGNYHLNVVVNNRCAMQNKDFELVVRDVPEVTFSESMPTEFCMERDSTLTLDMGNYVSYTWNNNPDSVIWKLNLPVGGSYEYLAGTDSSSLYPQIKLKGVGTCVFSVEALSNCGSDMAKTEFELLADFMEARFENNVTESCLPTAITFTRTSIGDGLVYKWMILKNGLPVGVDDLEWKTPETAADITVQFNNYGMYEVQLIEKNYCKSDTFKQQLRLFEQPEITKLENPEAQCGNASFNASTHFSYNENGSATLVNWEILRNNKPWKNFNDPSPILNFPYSGTYKITATLTNECAASDNKTISIQVDSALVLDVGENIQTCLDAPFVPLLDAHYNTGDWYCIEDQSRIEVGGVGENKVWKLKTDEVGVFHLVYALQNGVCLLRDSLTIEVKDLPELFLRDTLICINNLDGLPLHFSPKGGVWSGDGVEKNGVFYVVSLPNKKKGFYTLTYNYKDSITGCSNSATMQIEVKPKPNPQFYFSKKRACIFEPIEITPENLDGIHQIIWDFGDSTRIALPYDAIASHIYTDSGVVTVKAVYISEYGCLDSISQQLLVLGPPPPAQFDFDSNYGYEGEPYRGCGPFNPHFTVETLPYHRYEQFQDELQYHWDFGNGETFDGLIPPDTIFYKQGLEDSIYTVRLIVNNACFADTFTHPVIVEPVPIARFAMMHQWDCSPVKVRFVNNSRGLPKKFYWDFGDGSTSTEKEPTHEFVVDTFTVFSIRLIAENECGLDTITKELAVKPGTVDAYFSVDKRIVCQGEPITFTNYSSDRSYEIIKTVWDFGDGNRDTATQQISHTYQSPGLFYVKLSVNNYCGYDTIMDSILVEPTPNVEIMCDDEICAFTPLQIQLKSDYAIGSYLWHFDDLDSMRNAAPGYVFKEAGMHTVQVSAIARDGVGTCVSHDEKSVRVFPVPHDSIVPQIMDGCSPLVYHPIAKGSGDYYMWNYGVDSLLSTSSEYVFSNQTNALQRHKITLMSENKYGCADTSYAFVTVRPEPISVIEEELLEDYPEKVLFYNYSSDATRCVWLYENGDSVFSCDNQVRYFSENGTYTIRLITYNQYNCTSEDSIIHQTEKCGLFFPNAFIPGHQNADIAIFKGVGMGLLTYHLEIYDKWNNKIWETERVVNGKPAEGWDGKDKNGVDYPQGVYYWRCKADFLNTNSSGSVKRNKGETKTQGTITILR